MRVAILFAWVGLISCVPNEPSSRTEGKAAPAAPDPAANPPRRPPSLRPPPDLREARPKEERVDSKSAAQPDPGKDALITERFFDDFERPSPGDDWLLTSPAWKISGGQLCAEGARNHPAWLRRRLPDNARIEFDAITFSADGDLKAELWGDGRGHAKGVTYDHATSYLVIFGGWKNQFHVLARQDEHARNRPEVRIDPNSDDPRARRVEPTQSYRFKVERDDGKTVRWYVDDLEILAYPDPAPRRGPGHDHFGFNDWDVRVCFDNLSITPL